MSDKAISAGNQQATFRVSERESSETIRQTPHLNGEFASLIGLLFTDGCVSPKGNSWRIYFANKSSNLINLFQDCMVAVFKIAPYRVRIREIKNANGVCAAVVGSKEIGNCLVGRFGTFRTLKFKNGELPDARLPITELLESGCIKNFLQAAFSCDGGVSFYPASRVGACGGTKWLIRTVFLSCAHPKLRSDYLKLLKVMNIKARNVPGDNKIKIETKENIKKFQENIGFVSGTVITDHSRYWRGLMKQEVLNIMVASYQDPASIYRLSKFQV